MKGPRCMLISNFPIHMVLVVYSTGSLMNDQECRWCMANEGMYRVGRINQSSGR